jgi:hypothetical protein
MSAVIEDRTFDYAYVDAVVNYTRNTGVRPVNYTFDPPAGVPRNSGEVDARTVRIRNARYEFDVGLDVTGFEMIPHRSSLTQWRAFRDVDQVKAIDYPEVIAALKRQTGAEKIVIFDYTLRDSTVEPGRGPLREPVRRVHNDQTFNSAPRRLARHLSPEELEWRLRRRFAILNFWRPIEESVQQMPLSVCDARTLDTADLIPSDLVYRDWVGETYAAAYSPRHVWYSFPRQTPSEATLLKIYDSATDGRARFTLHTAFEDPTSDAKAAPSRSIEIRAIVLW